MSYIKLGQIMDSATSGIDYLEDESRNVINSQSLVFPLSVKVEVISWHSLEEQQKHGIIDAFASETVIVPDESVSIRQSVFDQLVSEYPTLVM